MVNRKTIRGRFVSEPAVTRFWSRVKKCDGDGCWEWQAGKKQGGYGSFAAVGTRTQGAHRWSWEHSFGPIPKGLCVCHRCDNPSCVRPDHLFLGTLTDNARDRDAKGRNVVSYGERVGTARLTDDAVRWLRAEYAKGERGIDTLARELGMSKTPAWNAATGRTWKHVK